MEKDIEQLKYKLNRIEKIKKYLPSYEKKLSEIQKKKVIAEENLEKENKDVEKLKRISFAAFVAYLQKNKEDCLAKEEQEALQAAFQLRQLEEDEKVLLHKIEDMKKELKNEKSIRKELEELELKETASHSPYGEELFIQRDKVRKLSIHLKEIAEAIHAGNQVLDLLNQALSSLESAESWGLFDIVGGGFISTMAKHSHLDTAQEHLAQLKLYMDRFRKEVADVKSIRIDDVKLSGGLTLADYAFDNVFMDLFIQSKISSSKDQVKDAIDTTTKILKVLKKQNDVVRAQLKKEKEYFEIMKKS